jgi:hypothetical protein
MKTGNGPIADAAALASESSADCCRIRGRQLVIGTDAVAVPA